MTRDASKSGAWAGLNELMADRTTDPDIYPLESAAATDAASTQALANEMRSKLNFLISAVNRRQARLRDAAVFIKQTALAQLGATVGIANNAAVATLVLTKAELDGINSKVNAILALFRTNHVIPTTGADAIADIGATTGEANNASSSTLIALKAEGDTTVARVNALLAALRLSTLPGVPSDLAALTGLANNAAVATAVATKAEHDTTRTKVNAVLTRAASIGILES